MSYEKKLKIRAKRRKFRVKNSFVSRGILPRVSVFRSLNQIYAQIIDDSTHSTLASFSSLVLKEKGTKAEIAKKVGIELGKIAKSKSVEKVFFDRGKYAYHGRVAALADGLRESGLNF
ncbi:TPA: 50S ribosomal protein L18 [Candidatus Dependentiae bacterium]|nr:MAG: 50S ribosomal protein L18 [candidate division TM6 bacterium GW2011_GWE2_31_21]KKP53111.1 MAG: 50S ribosomal protein L18 [candidate division TM6 bacterium GW2011_GWF2_33_332]HBS47930.1 50S ribosomal protein L18 [Candidatus Dependentiae bacterium]HBZ73466.1 50S ribosomal protein L18 [Candidatus Dependentiae bacterium]